ncbi:MAG: 2Fe-2S iron-sulfur cluster-binding protein, partial [Rhodococcus sp. (in: high G+C Gram-positive bacteria)]
IREIEGGGVAGDGLLIPAGADHDEEPGRPPIAEEAEGIEDRLHMERFAVSRIDASADGGTVTFEKSGKTITVDGATTLLEAGEQSGALMPFGCRMGICQTCVVPLVAGHAIDLRSGKQHAEGERIQTCISAAAGDCTLDA